MFVGLYTGWSIWLRPTFCCNWNISCPSVSIRSLLCGGTFNLMSTNNVPLPDGTPCSPSTIFSSKHAPASWTESGSIFRGIMIHLIINHTSSEKRRWGRAGRSWEARAAGCSPLRCCYSRKLFVVIPGNCCITDSRTPGNYCYSRNVLSWLCRRLRPTGRTSWRARGAWRRGRRRRSWGRGRCWGGCSRRRRGGCPQTVGSAISNATHSNNIEQWLTKSSRLTRFQIVIQLISVLFDLWISCTTTRKSTKLRILSVPEHCTVWSICFCWHKIVSCATLYLRSTKGSPQSN